MNVLFKSIPIIFISFILAGCPLEGNDGATGTIDSVDLAATLSTLPGVNCWDVNADGVQDFEEDRNHDGTVDVKDCHVDEDIVRQNPSALYDQEKMCKVLHALGLGNPDAPALADAIKDLGCHSLPEAIQTGILTRIHFADFQNDTYPTLFDFQPTTTTNEAGFDWVIKQAYVAKTLVRPLVEHATLRVECEQACKDDSECIAAAIVDLYATGASHQDLNHCQIFHHSDQLTTNWTHFCGYFIDGEEGSCKKTQVGQLFWGKVL